MKIEIREDGHRIVIPIPSCLLYSRLGIRMALGLCPDAVTFNGALTPKEAEELLRRVGQFRRRYGPWELVHVESADGEVVSITV